MLVIVHTLTMTLGDLEVNAVFYHGLEKQKRDFKFSLLKRRFAFKRLKGKYKKPFYRQKLSAFGYKHERKLIENVFSRKRFVPQAFSAKDEGSPPHDPPTPPSSPKQKVYSGVESQENNGVCSSWGPQQTAMWLQSNRYGPHMQTLSSYSGADLLRLSKENLIQLCGLPDGIRLHNALHAKCILPKLTLYICVDLRERVYQVVYLNLLTRSELLSKISNVLGLVSSQISSAYVLGPNGIKLLMTDQLVAHMTDHSAYAINMAQDGSDRYQLLFKLTENTAPA